MDLSGKIKLSEDRYFLSIGSKKYAIKTCYLTHRRISNWNVPNLNVTFGYCSFYRIIIYHLGLCNFCKSIIENKEIIKLAECKFYFKGSPNILAEIVDNRDLVTWIQEVKFEGINRTNYQTWLSREYCNQGICVLCGYTESNLGEVCKDCAKVLMENFNFVMSRCIFFVGQLDILPELRL